MSDLHEELDRALRAVPVPGAPVERARRDGRRLRTRRRAAVVAGALAVVAVAAGYPALAGNFTSGTGRPTVANPTKPGRDPVVTDGPPADATQAANGVIAQGRMDALQWQAVLETAGRGNSDGPCYEYRIDGKGQNDACGAQPGPVSPGLATEVSVITGDKISVAFGVTAKNVTYLVVTFTDGQQLKLVPVSVAGHRYIAWAASPAMTVASVTAHLGGPSADSGQTETAIPLDLGRGDLYIGRWQPPGQPTPPRAQATLAHGGAGQRAWAVTGYEGPWGTCIVTSRSGETSAACRPENGIGSTKVFGWSVSPWTMTGSAAPDVALIKVTGANGTSGQAKPVTVGNERLFAVSTPVGPGSFTWVAYNAAGQEVGHGQEHS